MLGELYLVYGVGYYEWLEDGVALGEACELCAVSWTVEYGEGEVVSSGSVAVDG